MNVPPGPSSPLVAKRRPGSHAVTVASWANPASVTFDRLHTQATANMLGVAREAGVSVRGLQMAFQQFKDMTPMTYLRQMRLDGVRRDLKSCRHRDVLISDIAKRWGFSHMGRFSAMYVNAFGEIPRQTLNRSR